MKTESNSPANVPEDVLIILGIEDVVLFPGVVLPIAIKGARALAAAQEAVRTQRRVGLLLRKSAAEGNESAADADAENLYTVGSTATIVRFVRSPT